MKCKNFTQRNGRWLLVAALLCGGAIYSYATDAAEPATQSSQAAIVTQTGTVVDTFGEPIIGASVIVEGAKNGVNTDINGNAKVEVVYDPNSTGSDNTLGICLKPKKTEAGNVFKQDFGFFADGMISMVHVTVNVVAAE